MSDLQIYRKEHGLDSKPEQQCLTCFIQALNMETMAKVDPAGVAGPAAELLWTSALKFEGMDNAHEK